MATAVDSTIPNLSGTNMYIMFYHQSSQFWPQPYGTGDNPTIPYKGCGICSSAEALAYLLDKAWNPEYLL